LANFEEITVYYKDELKEAVKSWTFEEEQRYFTKTYIQSKKLANLNFGILFLFTVP